MRRGGLRKQNGLAWHQVAEFHKPALQEQPFSHFSCQNANERNSRYLGEEFDTDKLVKN